MKQRTLSSWILISDLLWSTLAMGGAATLRYGTKIAHVEMGRDKRQYRFVQDTRYGRAVLA